MRTHPCLSSVCICVRVSAIVRWRWSSLADDRKISEEDYATIDKRVAAIVRENQPFQRIVMRKEDALEMFKVRPARLRVAAHDSDASSCVCCSVV